MFPLKQMTRVSHDRILSTVLAASMVIPGSIRSFGQENPAAQPPRESASESTRGATSQPANATQPSHQIQIFPLKNAEAKDVSQTIRQLHEGQRPPSAYQIAVDQRTNSIIISAQSAMIAEIEELITALDKAAGQEQDQQVKIFQLLYNQVSPPLLNMLSTVADNQTRLSADERINAIIAAGPTPSLQIIEALVLRLEEMASANMKLAGQTPQEMQLRLVWLAAGLADSSADDPPQDLRNVLSELEKIGVTGLKLITQTVVKTIDGQQFSVSGSAQLDEPCRLNISGSIMQDRPSFASSPDAVAQRSLKLQISAFGEGNPNSRLCQLETTIHAPPGQSVVLGVTPINSKPTVFVVQMMLPAGEAKK